MSISWDYLVNDSSDEASLCDEEENGTLDCLILVMNRPFAANDHVVQNPPCWRASSLLFPHWDIKTKASQASLVQVSLFYCPSAGIIMSLPSSMADFVPRDR